MRAFAVALLVSGSTLFAQPEPAFEVASIKRNTSLSEGGGGGPQPGGRYRLTNMSSRSLIGAAWNIPTNRVLGGPGWIAVDRYDIDATMNEGASFEETRAMLRRLLRERFSLAAHVEQQDLPVYLLTRTAPAGQLGPGLELSQVDCSDPEARKRLASAPNARPGRLLCGFGMGTGSLDAGGITMETLTQILTGQSGRPVIDRTGLPGNYNVQLKWTPSLGTDTPTGDGVTLFTALREQLGLKLEAGTASLDVVVVERLERPSEN